MGNRKEAGITFGEQIPDVAASIDGTANDFFLTYVTQDGKLKQKYLPDLADGDEVAVDDSQTPAPDHIVLFDVPANSPWSIDVRGRELGQSETESGYLLDQFSGSPGAATSIQTGFEFSASAAPRYHHTVWLNPTFGNTFFWTTFSTAHHQKLGILPPSILASNPEFDIDKLVYSSTDFYTSANYSLSDYLSRQFRNQPDPADVEYSLVSITKL